MDEVVWRVVRMIEVVFVVVGDTLKILFRWRV